MLVCAVELLKLTFAEGGGMNPRNPEARED